MNIIFYYVIIVMIVCVVYLKNMKLFSKFSSVFQYTTNGIAVYYNINF